MRSRAPLRGPTAAAVIATAVALLSCAPVREGREVAGRRTPGQSEGAAGADPSGEDRPGGSGTVAPTVGCPPGAALGERTDRTWGLHCTDAELRIWRDRARSGPYRSRGDAGHHTPGDWDRITANTEMFLADPDATVWSGPPGDRDTCVQQGDEGPPVDPPSALRDAAFVALVERRADVAVQVRETLLRQAREEGVDFGDRERWCERVLYDVGPSFPISHWLTKLLFAYDYLGPAVFSPAELDELDRWFAAGARWLQADLDASLDGLFVDRRAGDYELVVPDPTCDRTHFFGGPPNCSLHRVYNNRRGAIARYVGLVGLHQGDADLQESARRFVEEFLRFTVFPEGFLGEFERWEDRLPDLGWAYATQALGPVVVIADAFARTGDDRLYEFVTSDGALGTAGGAKSIAFAVDALGGHLDGVYERYATDDPDAVGDPATLIDGRHRGWISLHDLALVPSNRYYRDARTRERYLRTELGGYPESPAPIGPHPPWTGEGGIFPGVLFMFGDLEDEPSPYGRAPTPD